MMRLYLLSVNNKNTFPGLERLQVDNDNNNSKVILLGLICLHFNSFIS